MKPPAEFGSFLASSKSLKQEKNIGRDQSNMDGQESSDKKEKMSTKVRVVQTGGVNVGGLLVVVGALAVSGLVGVVASRIKKRRDAKDEGRRSKEGLPSVLETHPRTSHRSQCCKSYELRSNRMDSVEMMSSSLTLEESPVPGVLDQENGNRAGGDEEVLVKAPVPATIVVAKARDDPDEPEEIQLPAPDGCFDTGEETPSIEVSEAGKAEQSTVDMEAGSEEKTTLQPLPEKQAGQGSYNCEDREIREEDHTIGKNEEVSEGTGNASGESGAGNIRPPDLLWDLPPVAEATLEGQKMVEEEEETDQFKGSSSSSCCNTINNFEDGTTRDLKDSRFFQKGKAMELLLVMSDQVEHKLKTGIWGLSLLGIMLMFCYYLPMTTACLTALFVTVLSFKA